MSGETGYDHQYGDSERGAAMMAARVVARLAGPLPVRLVAVSLRQRQILMAWRAHGKSGRLT